MSKITWTFKNEEGTNLNRYKATNVATGEEVTFDLLRNGNISIVGTPLNATNLNALISSINACYDLVTSTEKDTTYTLTKSNNTITLTGSDGKSTSVTLTKSDIGLGNVDNTSDVNKPVSTKQQQAIDTSLNNAKSYTDTQISNVNASQVNNDNLLGAYDTISGNTITRQTGYDVINGTQSGAFIQSDNLIIPVPYTTNSGQQLEFVQSWNAISAIQWAGAYIPLSKLNNASSVEDANKYLSANPIYIQYKLATSYTEPKYNYFQQLVRKDSQDFLVEEFDKSSQLLKSYVADSSHMTCDNMTLESGTYTISIQGVTFSSGGWVVNINGSAYNGVTYNLATTTSVTFTLTTTSTVNFYANTGNSNAKIMLNKGNHALPYQEYNGAVVHTSLTDYIMQNITITKTGQLSGTTESTSILPATATATTTIDTGLDANNIVVSGINCNIISKNYNSSTGVLTCVLASNNTGVLKAAYNYPISLYREYYKV